MQIAPRRLMYPEQLMAWAERAKAVGVSADATWWVERRFISRWTSA